MAFYINKDHQSFVADQNQFFQDKSKLIVEMNKLLDLNSNKFICVTRPRRFGKSMAINMLNAYYSKGSDANTIFSNLAVKDYKYVVSKDQNQKILNVVTADQLEKYNNDPSVTIRDYTDYLNKYDVINIDFNSVSSRYLYYVEQIKSKNQNRKANKLKYDDLINFLLKEIINELRDEYPQIISKDLIYDLPQTLKILHEHKKCKFIFLIDEWDVIFRDPPFCNQKRIKEKYVKFLSSLFKDSNTMEIISLAYITGILPIQKFYSESSLNNFIEYSMLNPGNLVKFYGFTKEEVQSLCTKYNKDYEQMSEWYDGYLINGTHIYNPYSVSNCLLSGIYKCYWTQTSASSIAFDYIFSVKKVKEGKERAGSTVDLRAIQQELIALMSGKRVVVDLNSFDGNPQSIKTKAHLYSFLINLGYLTYELSATKTLDSCSIKIPNKEIKIALQNALLENETSSNRDPIVHRLIEASHDLFNAMVREHDAVKVAHIVQEFHNNAVEFIAINEFNDESALRYTIQTLMLFSISKLYHYEKEVVTGKGFADLMYIPNDLDNLQTPPLIIELKRNSSSKRAIDQIKERDYKQRIRLMTNNPILYVGINYDATTKEHDCDLELELN